MIDPNQPILIEPTAIYDDAALVLSLGLTTAALARERRNGRLRFIKRGRRVLYRGDWILAWLESDCEADRKPHATAPHASRGGAA